MTEGLISEAVREYMKPELVSPAVAWMCSEQCNVSGEVIGGSAGFYRRVKYMESEGVQFDPGEPVTLEMFAEAVPKIMDMSHPLDHSGGGSRRMEARLRAMGRIA
jgi:hypothetical protein